MPVDHLHLPSSTNASSHHGCFNSTTFQAQIPYSPLTETWYHTSYHSNNSIFTKGAKADEKEKTFVSSPRKTAPQETAVGRTRNPSLHDPLEILDFPAQNPVGSFYQYSGFSPNMQTTLAITHKKDLHTHANTSLQTIQLIHRFSTQQWTPDDEEEEERSGVSILS